MDVVITGRSCQLDGELCPEKDVRAANFETPAWMTGSAAHSWERVGVDAEGDKRAGPVDDDSS